VRGDNSDKSGTNGFISLPSRDRTRLNFDETRREMTQPLLRQNGKNLNTSKWEEGLEHDGKKEKNFFFFTTIATVDGGARIGVIGSDGNTKW